MELVNAMAKHLSSAPWSRRRSAHAVETAEAEFVRAHPLALQAHQLQKKQRQIDELEAANAELRMFAATAAHDLKSPLTTIIGFATLAERELDNVATESVRTCLRRVRTAAQRMGELLDDLQELAGDGRLIDDPDEVGLAGVVGEVLDQLAGPIADRGVEVEVARAFPKVLADRYALARVLQNLVENAVRYMGGQPRPRIEIAVRHERGRVLLSVRDNGIGIARDQQQRVFEPFERLLDDDCAGSGLGLYIVRRIVEAHGGRVWVESEGDGQGSTFWLSFRAA